MKIVNFVAAAFLGLLLTQCYPDGPDYVEEIDLTYTNYDNKYDFKAQSTYAMSDSIIVIDEGIVDGSSSRAKFVKPVYSNPIIKSINDNMKDLGWTKVDVNANPDVIIHNAYTELTTTYMSYYGGYYDWWYGGYYGGYYGWYYPYPVTYSYTTGNLITNMVDTKSIDFSPAGNGTVVWLSVVNGLADYSNFASRVNQGVNQAFVQSPYLNTK